MTIIRNSGFYPEITAEQYHQDPCVEPSLSNSIAKKMLSSCPLAAFNAHPRLNPNPEPNEPSNTLDFGTLVHALLLGKGRDIVVVDKPDWRTKAARETRETATADGKVVMLAHQYARAEAEMLAVRDKVVRVADCDRAFIEGDAEMVMVWQEGPTWCRSMVDWIEPRRATGHVVVYDLKTTAMSAAPHAVSRLLYGQEYEMQAAFVTAGIEALVPDAAGKVIVRFVVVENDPPHMASVVELDAAGLTIGRKKMHAALGLWQRCLADDNWPGYPDRIVEAELPPWLETGWLEREMGDPMIAPPEDEPEGEYVNLLAAG